MRRALKRWIAQRMPTRSDGLPILLYHAIAEPIAADPLALAVRPDAFRIQMRRLIEEGFRITSLREALDLHLRDERVVALTFDDGYRNQLDAAEILADLGASATFFLITGRVDGAESGARGGPGRWPSMNWSEARDLLASGFEVGSHSVTHPDLSRLERDALTREIAGSRHRIEERTGAAASSFSFPYGRFNRLSRGIAEEAGYAAICTSRCGLNRSPIERTYLRRTEVDGEDSAEDVLAKAVGCYDWLGRWHDVAHPLRGWAAGV